MSKIIQSNPLTVAKNEPIYVNSVPEDWTIRMLMEESNRLNIEGRKDNISNKLELAAFLLHNELSKGK